ncbi:hypothetical protein ACFWP5_35670 [Streptomyces sp. NPDC058469]|uniref:nSTAND1 domain-containing NTPase n=1 Tax=Streptomyces sp. NPDC058469 TaxID=3346514 RepID=UPI00365153FF
MARRAHYSAATLAQAAGGERLPSLAVVQAYARACDADPGEWEARWKAAAEEERAARQDGSGGGDEPPYRGLVRFEPGDEALFFGRERLVGELLELVYEHRLAMVFGASGSGKSSLLRAGLIPRLRRRVQEDGCAAVLRVLTPGATPAATHGHLLVPGDAEPDSGTPPPGSPSAATSPPPAKASAPSPSTPTAAPSTSPATTSRSSATPSPRPPRSGRCAPARAPR